MKRFSFVVALLAVALFALGALAFSPALAGNCDYPWQYAADGSRCGARAASVRPGGALGGYGDRVYRGSYGSPWLPRLPAIGSGLPPLFGGGCDYPWQRAADGSRCGKRAASVRPGGALGGYGY